MNGVERVNCCTTVETSTKGNGWMTNNVSIDRDITIFGEELFVNVKNEQTKKLIICNIVQNSDSIKVK